MKTIYVQRQVISWEEYTYEVPDDFEDYESLVGDDDWKDWEYLPDTADFTGEYEILDENGDRLINDDD